MMFVLGLIVMFVIVFVVAAMTFGMFTYTVSEVREIFLSSFLLVKEIFPSSFVLVKEIFLSSFVLVKEIFLSSFVFSFFLVGNFRSKIEKSQIFRRVMIYTSSSA